MIDAIEVILYKVEFGAIVIIFAMVPLVALYKALVARRKGMRLEYLKSMECVPAAFIVAGVGAAILTLTMDGVVEPSSFELRFDAMVWILFFPSLFWVAKLETNLRAERKKLHVDSNNYVDLGLPSGKLWATENKKYGDDAYFTFDRATELFGNSLPSKEDWKELFDNCKREWNKERKGYTVTGPNGNSIFLPAAGCRDGVSVFGVGSRGYYWSSSVYDEYDAYGVYIYGGYLDPQRSYKRCHGFSVRLVKNKAE